MSNNAAMLQVEVHPNFRNERTIDWCKQEGIHVTAYAPLSSPQTMSSQKKSVPNLLEVSHVCHHQHVGMQAYVWPWQCCRILGSTAVCLATLSCFCIFLACSWLVLSCIRMLTVLLLYTSNSADMCGLIKLQYTMFARLCRIHK